MSAEGVARGQDLVEGGKRIGLGPQWLARAVAGGLSPLLDRIDRALVAGKINGTLPDGSRRVLGGHSPGFEVDVHLRDWRAMLRLVTGGSIGWFQAWEAGEWSSPDPVSLFALFVANADRLGKTGRASGPWRWFARGLHWLHRNTRDGAAHNIHAHYDLGNDFYAAWLDPAMVYSSARFDRGAETLAGAQAAKLDTMAERISGAQSVLEIGCGWGALAGRLNTAGVAVTAISLSDQQLAWAREHFPGIDFRHLDYRDVSGNYDGIVSVEMVEAVGREYWPAFFDCLARCLKPGGRAAIQYISIRDSIFPAYARGVDFIQAYVFPGGMLASTAEFRRLAAERGLEWRDQADFGQDYARTLRQWRERFDTAAAQGRLPAGFDERFVRFWRYYLMYCEGGFLGGGIDVSQVTLIKP